MSISTLFSSLRHTNGHNTIVRCFAVTAALAMCAPSYAEIKIVHEEGDPTWKPRGFVQSTVHDIGSSGSEANANVRALLTEMLGGTHDSRSSNAFIPGTAHDGPYDMEFRVALAASGVINTDVFLASDLVLPNLELLNYVIVPTQDAPLGTSNDFSRGPIISEELFPIRVSDSFRLDGRHIGTNSTRFNSSDALSHLPVYDLSGRHPGEPVIGRWEGNRKLRDAQGNGYDILETFTVVENPTDIFGDFSYDEKLDHHDLNILTQNVAVGAINLQLDMNGDEQVNVDDIHFWVTDLKSTWIGDTNLDGEFDGNDIVNVLQAGRFGTDQFARWDEGDWSGDERFDRKDIIVALQDGGYGRGPRTEPTSNGNGGAHAAIGPNGRTGDDQTSLVYDAGTGQLSLDAPTGQELTSINVTSAAGRFLGDAPALLDGAFDNFASDNIFKATFGGSFGSISFGNVLPVGIAESDLTADLSAVGSLAGGGDLGNVDLVYVPEPTSMLLMAVGLAIGVICLRRNAR